MSPFLVLMLMISSIVLVFTQEKTSSKCESRDTCSDCMQGLDCVWCITLKENTSNHCIQRSPNNDPSWCDPRFVVDLNGSSEIPERKPLSSVEGSVVQITPQKVKLVLRKGEKYDLQFQYKRAKDFPLDLYYIMDFSASMEDHKTKLGTLGETLAMTMKNLTSNFRLGFGTFVDKVALPFTSTVPAKLQSPCSLTNSEGKVIKCASPYSFKNHLTLTDDYDEFTTRVREGQVSGNLDSPEGGFDAIMQAIVCPNVTGWRSHARHLLVFSTDAVFHIAGDGRLAGAIEPNDAQCHMVNDTYVEYLKYDYPSISQINYVAKQNNINIIFAIVNKNSVILPSYKTLSENIENSNFGTLDGHSTNVVNLVVDNYNKIVDSVTLTTNSPKDIEVKISSNCNNPIENGCTNVHVTDTVDFTATIKPLECSKTGSNTKKFTIKPEALLEGIEIELEVLCSCGCESEPSEFFRPNATECSNSGNLTCGICACAQGRFGFDCQCGGNSTDTADDRQCVDPDDPESVCSGFGDCKCGRCECFRRLNANEKHYGKYCQCNNYSCNRDNGKLCAGRGTCDCGECQCEAGWTGPGCGCRDSNATCVKPGTDGSAICSGNGACVCGECACAEKYYGAFCEDCTSCSQQRQRCEEFRDCVECRAYKQGRLDETECRLKCDPVELMDSIDEFSENTCRFSDRDGCTFSFYYEYSDGKNVVFKAAKEKVCVGVIDLLVWILAVIGTIVFAGLIILIIWKVCTTVHDRREYEKFEKERQELKWNRNDNPTYKAPTTTFRNPFYSRNSAGSHRFSFKK